jgi:hypothetical protein
LGEAPRAWRGLYLAAAALLAVSLLACGAGTSTGAGRSHTFRAAVANSPIDLTGEAPHPVTTTTAAATTTTSAVAGTTAAPATGTPPTSRPPAVVATHRPAAPTTVATTFGCAAALAYLEAHANPAARFECPAWASGHQAETCYHAPPTCGRYDFVIRIWVPCPAAYMNEAWNSNHLHGPYDPFGYCS